MLVRAKKWYVVQQAFVRNDVVPATSAFSRLLFECKLMQELIIADEIIQFIIQQRVPINSMLAPFMLTSEAAIRSADCALDMWESLSTLANEQVKWHGSVLYAALSIAASAHKEEFIKRVVKELCDRSEAKYGGSWPTPFYETLTQKRRFSVASTTIAEVLRGQHRGESIETCCGDEESHRLAERWEHFCAVQDRLYGDRVKLSKKQRSKIKQ